MVVSSVWKKNQCSVQNYLEKKYLNLLSGHITQSVLFCFVWNKKYHVRQQEKGIVREMGGDKNESQYVSHPG